MSEPADRGGGRRLQVDLTAVLVGLALAVMVVLQGGFFALAPCLCGIPLCVVAGFSWARRDRRSQVLPAVVALFLALPLAYLMSAVRNGLTLTTLSACGVWCAPAAMACLAAAQDGASRARTLWGLCLLGACTAAAGLATYAGALVLPEGMVGDRLQFSFQYANAAAAWFGGGLLLCMLAPDGRLRRLAMLPATAFLLTQSVGASLTLMLLAACAGVVWVRAERWEPLAQALTCCFGALASFALLHLLPTPLMALAVLVAQLAFALRSDRTEEILARVGWRRVTRVATATLGAALLLAAILLRSRLSAALASLVERLYQVHDGLSLWWLRPVLGVGPDNWQYLYRFVQTAQYDSAVVHGSYVQVLLDAGLPALALLLAAAACGLRTGWRAPAQPTDATVGAWDRWRPACRAAAAFVLLHATLEFDLRFSSLACLVAWLLVALCPMPEHAEAGETAPAAPPVRLRLRGLPCSILCLLVCLSLCTLGCLSQLSQVALRLTAARGDYASCERLFSSNPLARADVQAQETHLAALCAQGKWEQTVDAAQLLRTPSDASVLSLAQAHLALGQNREAGDVLLRRMEEQPFNVAFFEEAATTATQWARDPNVAARYREAVSQANQLAAQVSPLLPQRRVAAET